MRTTKTCMALLACTLLFTSSTFGADCRSGSAAQAGAEAGYNAAKKAADAWNVRENSASSKLQECLDKIRSLSISLPDFSSLSSILNQYADKICNAGVDEINSYIPSDINPWDEFTE